jgi:hypothetical protein
MFLSHEPVDDLAGPTAASAGEEAPRGVPALTGQVRYLEVPPLVRR